MLTTSRGWLPISLQTTLLGLALGMGGCSDVTFFADPDPIEEPQDGSVSGRVCDESGKLWLADALVYTNTMDEDGKVIGVQKAYSDRDGYWVLDGLAPGREYTIYVQHGSSVIWEETRYVGDGEDVRLEEPACFDPHALNIGVVLGDYDDMHRVLQNMGFINYTLIDGTDCDELGAFLGTPANLEPFDLIFFNGGHCEEGLIYDSNPSNELPENIRANLKDYVWNGGSVYASDWAYDILELAWPDAVDFLGDDLVPNAAQHGDYDDVQASVIDASLAEYLKQDVINISYDLPVWPPILGVEGYVSIHLAGDVHYRYGSSEGIVPAAPLLASFSGGNGRVIFSTFRAVANQDQVKEDVIQYLLYDIAN